MARNIPKFIDKNAWSILLQAAALLALLANLWIASQLAPLITADAIIVERVSAIEEANLVPRSELDTKFDATEKRLERIENKIDRLIERESLK